ncbi:hypothetical protein ACFY2R_00195 [Micromonospora olivasterospora]|uniref:Uncharacterized protein n=1 Tax=Micromonospora olivasterospora TaxID=1880 RepID=A0A562I9I9_MICOL|nr:hypothetical protein [Micromonospora olivasterospora]TWH67689.1 hypothetical protein JD77_02669 [Micromonospora olivasterospora]
MARTDVHRPFWVQERDPYCRREFRVRHNHWFLDEWDPELKRYLVKLSIPCDLHERDGKPRKVWTRCGPTFTGTRGCCGLCASQPGRKRRRRQEHHGWRAMRHQLLAAHRGGHRDLDVPPINGKAWR